jgi:hypothetical protein
LKENILKITEIDRKDNKNEEEIIYMIDQTSKLPSKI